MEREQLEGHLDVLLLAAIAAGDAHGYAIIERLREQSQGLVDLREGTAQASSSCPVAVRRRTRLFQ